MKFPRVITGFTTLFSLKPISEKVKYQVIVEELYNFLNIDDLETMKINQQYYLEIKQSSFLAVCSFCLNDIISTTDLKDCVTAGCLYKICSCPQCNYFVENKHYCNNFITVNEYIDNDTTERLFVGNNNDDCVTIFRNNEGDDDIQSVDLTLKSMGDNILFGKLLDYRLVDNFIVPDPEPL